MFAVVSPAKSLDLQPADPGLPATVPRLLPEAERLARTCRNLSQKRLRELMGISADLARLNARRFADLQIPFEGGGQARQAALLFAGDTYRGLDAATLSAEELAWSQEHLGLLSGLYGLLRPLDLIQPYRLEMGTALATRRGPNLYRYWGDRVTRAINATTEAHQDRTVVNLASQEYWGVVVPAKLKGPVVTCEFREVRDGQARIISFFAKRARGAMARFMVQQRVERSEELKAFDRDGYMFDPEGSSEERYSFLRG